MLYGKEKKANEMKKETKKTKARRERVPTITAGRV